MEQGKGFSSNSLTAGVIGTQDFRKDGVEYVVKKLCQHVRETLTAEEWSKYAAQKTDPARIQLFLRMKEIQSCVLKYLKLHPGQKNREKALLFKNAGNKAFGLGDNEKALLLYTQCLAWMPQDGTKGMLCCKSILFLGVPLFIIQLACTLLIVVSMMIDIPTYSNHSNCIQAHLSVTCLLLKSS